MVSVAPARRVPARRIVPGLLRDPLTTLEGIARRADGDVVRLDLGPFRPLLVTKPEHVQYFLVDNADNYEREGLLWTPVRGLLGDGLAGEGAAWTNRHEIVLPLFSSRYIASLVDAIAAAAAEELDELEPAARSGEPVDLGEVMTRVVNRVVIQAFFGGRISVPDAHRLRDALLTAFISLGPRMLLPFIPNAVPLPGSRAYRRAAKSASEILYPLIRQSREERTPGNDLVSMLCHARGEHGEGLTDQEIFDDLKAMFVASGETASAALTWLWVLLDGHPEVAARMTDEVARTVGTERPRREHLAGLPYTKMVLQELLRLYPPGWLLPRRAKRPDVIGGVPVKAGSTVIASPYVTQRMPWLWPAPEVFTPERFAAGAKQWHRYAYFPFGGGPHSCVGSNFFTIEAQVVIASVLSRYRVALDDRSAVPALPRVSLRPGRRIDAVLRPAGQP